MSALHVETSGRGPPLVLLHGWGLNLRVFDALRAPLAQNFTVIAIDLPGHGHSPWQPGLDAEAQLELLHDALPARASLLGWSLGGQLALQLAALAAARIERLVLLATTPCFLARADWPYGLAPAILERFALQLQLDYRQTVADFLELQVRGSANAAQNLRTLRGAILEHGEAQPQALAAGLELLKGNDLRTLLGAIATPTLVIGGENDRIAPAAASAELARALPRATLVRLQRAGHAPFLSHTAAVLASLRTFFA